jgi:hypothetical protein
MWKLDSRVSRVNELVNEKRVYTGVGVRAGKNTAEARRRRGCSVEASIVKRRTRNVAVVVAAAASGKFTFAKRYLPGPHAGSSSGQWMTRPRTAEALTGSQLASSIKLYVSAVLSNTGCVRTRGEGGGGGRGGGGSTQREQEKVRKKNDAVQHLLGKTRARLRSSLRSCHRL